MTLTGTNTYGGVTEVDGGIILLNGNGSILGTSGINITNESILILFNSGNAPERVALICSVVNVTFEVRLPLLTLRC